MKDKPPSHNSSVGYSMQHFEWCTKYRYEIFRKPRYKKIAEQAIRVAAWRHDIKIRELAVMPEHIHVSAETPPTMSQSKALHYLKGVSSRLIFEAAPVLRKRYPKGHLWSKGKFRGTTGPADIETTDTYVRNQRDAHQSELSGYFK